MGFRALGLFLHPAAQVSTSAKDFYYWVCLCAGSGCGPVFLELDNAGDRGA